jgi:hypothetical protein
MLEDIIELGSGDDVVDELTERTRGVDGWVQAVGYVDDAELRMAGEGADPRRTLYGRHTLVSLMGPAGGPYMATLSRSTTSGVEVAGGRLLRARSAGVHVVILRTRGEAARPAESAPTAAPAEQPAAPPPAGSGWAAIAAHTAERVATTEADEPEAELTPEPGDLVQHFAFGLCDVIAARGESLKLRDAHGPGRIREVRVDMLRVLPPRDKDGKRLFKLIRKS